MKLFGNLRALVLLFALLALVIGFSVLNAPKTSASGPCECFCMICSELPPYNCWCVCCDCGPILPPGPEGP